MTAADVIDKWLTTKRSVSILSAPGGAVVSTLPAGRVIGPVYSWVEKDGNVYWMFDYTIPGKAPEAYYVKHQKGSFEVADSGTSFEGPENGIFSGGFLKTATVMPKAKQLLLPLLLFGAWLIYKRVKK